MARKRGPAGVVGGQAASLADRVLALQRSAGNKAVASLVAAGRMQLLRCGCLDHGAHSCSCSGKEEQETDEHRGRAVANLRRAPRTLLARLTEPDFKPNPSWSTKGKHNPGSDCTPFWGVWGKPFEAHKKWNFYADRVPGAVTQRCGCSLVGDAYGTYLEARGKFTTLADDGNCISVQLAQDQEAHRRLEERLIDRWRDKGNEVVRQALAGGGDAEVDLVKALEGSFVPSTPGPLAEMNVDKDISYDKNSLAGGLLFGSASDDGTTPDSEFGPDTRRLTGTIKLHPLGGPDPTTLDVEETLTFRYLTHDALDFCPANTLRKPRSSLENIEYNQLLSDLSRLEASGMARDVGFDVRHHRTTTITRRLSRPTPPQPPTPPPGPKPGPKPKPKPGPKPGPRPGPKPGPKPAGRLTAARFLRSDGEPEPTLEACFEDRARLREGARGEAVSMVQQALVDLSPPFDLGRSGPVGDGVDGSFGPKTAAAIRAFKTREGLGFTEFGDVGPGTMHRLNELFSG